MHATVLMGVQVPYQSLALIGVQVPYQSQSFDGGILKL